MALRIAAQSGRVRSSSSGLKPDEQATDTAALISQLFIQAETSHIDAYGRLSETAEKLRRELGSQASNKDTFRHGGGFERILELFRLIEFRHNTSHDGEKYVNTHMQLVRDLFGLLATALSEHNGNERYFNNHLDGWTVLHHVFDVAQQSIAQQDSPEAVARDLAALYDRLIAFALGLDDFDEFSKQSGDFEQPAYPTNFKIRHPRICAVLLRLAVQPLDLSEPRQSDPILALSANVFRILHQVVQSSTRNTVDLWKTGVLSEVLRTALGPKVPTAWTQHLESVLLVLGRHGLNDLDDAAFLFSRANESDFARSILSSILQTSKEPAFFQFDLKLCGFSSIEFPNFARGFPSAVGYTLSAWMRIDEFDSKAHTTLFGAFDSSQKCFILMYLEKDSHQLILQTSIRAPNPSIRFKSTRFESSRLYHVVLAHRKNTADPAQSTALLFIDGQFAEQRRCIYPESPDDAGDISNTHASPVSGSRRSRSVQAFFGTPRNVATKVAPDVVTSRWSLGSAQVYSIPLTDEFIAVQYQLGPRYQGNFQDCLGPLLTYQASAELNRHNETLHPDKSDRSDIVTATEGRGSEVVPETRLLLSICPAAVIDFDSPHTQSFTVKYELDGKGLSKYQQLSHKASAVAVNSAVGTIGDALASSRGTGMLTGDPVIVVPQPLDNASWNMAGSLPVLVRLLEATTTKKAFLQAVQISFDCIKDNWRTSEAMEKSHGFGVFAMIIREKLGYDTYAPHTSHRRASPMLPIEDRQSLPGPLLDLILSFVGYDKAQPDSSLLVNPMAYRILLLDFDTWRRSDLETQRRYWAQFVHFVKGNKNGAFNLKRLVRMRVMKKLIEALKSEEISKDAAALMMASLKALLEGSSTQTLYRDLAMFVAFGLHDSRAMPSTVRSMASTVSLRQKLGSWARSARGSRPSTPGGAPSPVQEAGLPRVELALLVLRLLAETVNEDQSGYTVRRFNRAVPTRWLLHMLAESDVRVVELALSIISKSIATLGVEFKATFIEKSNGFITMRSRLKPFWRSKAVWQLCFAIYLGRTIPLDWLSEGFSAFHLVEMLSIDDKTTNIATPEALSTLFAMLEAGLRQVSKDDENDNEDARVLKTVIQFLGEIYDRSSAFREYAVNSRYLQELLFVLFPLLTGSDRLAAETELQSDVLSFKGEEVKMRPHSNSLGERPPSVRSLNMGKRSPSPMSANRVQAPQRISSFVLVNDDGSRLHVPPAQFNAPMSPKAKAPLKISITNSLVESLLESGISLFIDQVCYKDKFSGIGLFLKVPPGFREHQAYFESYVLVNSLSQLGSHLRLNQTLLVDTRVLTNLARFTQHMAEAVSEGWFIDGAQPVLDFTGEILEHLQQPEIASLKTVRLCSQSTNSIRVVFLKATLWRLAELDEDANEQHVGEFLAKMTFWQTILFAAENKESLFTKLICYLLYHKLVSGVRSVRLAAAQLWRVILVQKPTETATMLTDTMGPEQRHLSTGFMKLVSMDDDDFLAWIDQNRATLDVVFHSSLGKPWDQFVETQNRDAEEMNNSRLNKRREKLRQWQTEESTADDFIHKYEVSTHHWRSNVHAQERVKLQRGLQDHQESVNHLHTAFSAIEKALHQPCGLVPSSQPSKWRLDETEAVNRMRMRIIPDTNPLKDTFQPKRKASTRVANGRLAVNTSIPRIVADERTPTLPPTPLTPLQALTDGSVEQDEQQRTRSDSASNSQLLEGGFEIVDDPKEDEDGLIEDKNRKVMTSLQHGDMVQGLYNTSRIVGLEACEGLIVIGQKCLYMQDNFFQRSDGEIVSVSQAPEDERDPYVQLISGKDVGTARTKHSIGDQETRHWTWLEVLSVSKRRFLLRDVAIEVFFTDGRSYLLTCMSSKVRDDLYNSIVSRAPQVHSTTAVMGEDAWRLDTLRNPEEAPKKLGAKFGSLFNSGPANTATKRWQRGEMSNFQYLMLINTMAGRTFNDLTQYPVFPWVLSDYSSEELDLDDPKSYRDFSKPMGCQTPAREAEYKDRYQQFAEMGDGMSPSFHYGTHYSSAMIVSSFLIRLQPFVQSYLLLQGGSFDHADRLFDSIEKAWLSASRDTMSDVRELTPEFFYLPEFLVNINKYDFGTKQATDELVDDVQLPKWAKGDPQIFITKHREALESRYVSEHLHDWIDLVFGFKQRGEAAIEATNVFQHLSYDGAKDLDKIDDQVERLATIGIIHSFGQTPHQVFNKPHSCREVDRQAEQKLDTLAETLTRIPDTLLDIGEKVADLTFSPTHTRLLASGPHKLNMLPDCDRFVQWGFADNSIRFYSNNSKRLLGLYENTHVGAVTAATFSDSKTMITAGQDCTIGVWKISPSRNWIEIQSKAYLFGHRTAVTILAASRVFTTLVSASTDGQVLIWGLNRHDCFRTLLPAGGGPIQAARISNVSGHILLCQGPYALLYTVNGHLLVKQKLCDRDDDEILCCAFYEGAGGEYLERELIFTGHAHGLTNVWTLTSLSDGSWHLLLVKRMNQVDFMKNPGPVPAITAILPVAKSVYTGDEEGNVWSWECVVRHQSRGRI